MTTNISFSMSNVARTSVAAINADGTVSSESTENGLVFITPIVSQKGFPNEVISVNSSNWQDKLGKPYHSSKGVNADSLRVLAEAVTGGNGYVVRVVPSDATYPAIKLSLSGETGEVEVTNEAINYKNDLSLGDGEFLAISIKDGAESAKRSISMKAADVDLYGDDMWEITLIETDDTGESTELEQWQVSLDPEGTDSMGATAYIQTIFEYKSEYLACEIDSDAAMSAITDGFDSVNFTGASNGDIADITTADFDEAISLINTTVKNFNYITAFGIYDTDVHSQLTTLANNKRVSCAFDINPRLTHAEALAAKVGLGINEHRVFYTHFPYTSTDPYYKNKVMYGISGIVYRAKAAGVAKTSPTLGWHYTPAGTDRATISRTNLAPMKGAGIPDYDAMYTARLNKISVSSSGTLFIDDSLTSCTKENYLRFEQVVAIFDAISRQFKVLADGLKHQPDGVTQDGLTSGMQDILEGYESVGALVTPRDTDSDGTDAFTFSVEQLTIDSWKITWSACPTGSGRRFHGVPIVVE